MAEELYYIEDDFEDTQKDKFLTFAIDHEVYGLDISYVLEIIGVQEITEVPKQVPFIKGVINLRGKIIPVMDIRLRFGKEPRAYDDRTCVVVLNMQELTVGIIIDRVVEVLSIPENDISVPPTFEDKTQSNFIRGIGRVGEAVKLMLNVEQLITHGRKKIQPENEIVAHKEN